MAYTQTKNNLEGILVVDKPAGFTSHDVVAKTRNVLRTKKVGHAGTLDPLATGVLVLLIGKATKLFDKFVGFDKAYQANMILGISTDTADTEGQVIGKKDYSGISQSDVEQVFSRYKGFIDQLPPMYSAVKYKGKKLYELARKGITVERTPRRVEIKELRLEKFDLPDVAFYMECSKGAYVRQLAADIGEDLGCGACISQIRRTKVGNFSIKEAVSLEEIHESHIRDWQP